MVAGDIANMCPLPSLSLCSKAYDNRLPSDVLLSLLGKGHISILICILQSQPYLSRTVEKGRAKYWHSVKLERALSACR